MKPVITVHNVSKSYRIQHERVRYQSLREDMMQMLTQPWSVFAKNIRSENFWALHNISFKVQRGDTIGIIGANGAGKSTLLKILSRITPPSQGEIRLRGRVSSLLEVGTGFHPELTGRENIFLNGAVLGMTTKDIRRQLEAIVEFAEIAQFLDTPVKRYSSGMYVRLAFAVAAHLQQEILIVDEVLAVGDARFQQKCLGKMREAGKQGRTVIFVSHNMAAVRGLCKRALLLQSGRLIADDKTAGVISKYLSEVRENQVFHIWKNPAAAPQNESLILQSVRICDAAGDLRASVSTDDPFWIEIVYKVKAANATAGLTIILYDVENNIIFSSLNNHEPNWYGKMMPKGTYKSVCKVPAHLLNNGWVSVSINLFGRNFTDEKMTHTVVRFEVLDGAVVRRDYYGGYGGAVRPLLEWHTTQV